jgi:uncharacterized membrane protein YphA (DoxX/SURF4 family)
MLFHMIEHCLNWLAKFRFECLGPISRHPSVRQLAHIRPGAPAITFNQWFVPAVEFSAGTVVAVGLMAPLAALGLLGHRHRCLLHSRPETS